MKSCKAEPYGQEVSTHDHVVSTYEDSRLEPGNEVSTHRIEESTHEMKNVGVDT